MANVTKKKVAKPTAKIVKKAAAKTTAKSAPTKTAKTGSTNGAVKKVGNAAANAVNRTITFVKNRVDDPRELAVTGYRVDDKIKSAAKNVKNKATATLTQARGVSSTKKTADTMRNPAPGTYGHDMKKYGKVTADYWKNNPGIAKRDRRGYAQLEVMQDKDKRLAAEKQEKKYTPNSKKRVKK